MTESQPPTGLRVRLGQRGPIPLAVELDCAPGELLALVGPSGSGKSTILRAIAGHYRPAAGTVRVDGDCWCDLEHGLWRPPHRRRVGLVAQSYALFPHLDARANVAAGLLHLPRSERDSRAERWLHAVHLEGFGDRRPARLSGGQRQRVALARALAREPQLLLLDEPFSAVDRVTRSRLYQELAALRRRLPMPVVLVTHDIGEALMLADRMSVIHHGRTLICDAPAELLARPRSVEVARLLDLNNRFRGEITECTEHGVVLRWRGYRLEVTRHDGCAPGETVDWVIPAGRVLLRLGNRPASRPWENPVDGTIQRLTPLGDETVLVIAVDGDSSAPIEFKVRTRLVRANTLQEGGAVGLSLPADAIHLMP